MTEVALACAIAIVGLIGWAWAIANYIGWGKANEGWQTALDGWQDAIDLNREILEEWERWDRSACD